jgi:uracil-DNA glycosylase
MLADISADWQKIIARDELKEIEEKIASITPDDKLCPPKHQWFEFARITPLDEVKVVIIGQDPYHSPGDAHGLAFSSLSKKMPPSLKNVFKCLLQSKLIQEIPGSSNLTQWAKRGVLLINAGLSTEAGVAKKHMKIWAPYFTNIIKGISAHATASDRKLIFLLWGGIAKGFRSHIGDHHILTWRHPSPQAQSGAPENEKFINCDHFLRVCTILEGSPIDWSLTAAPEPTITHKVFTDGSCRGNGKKTATGSYAAIFVEGPWKGEQICGRLTQTTNIRAEGAAIIKVLEKLYTNLGEWDACEIYSDSEFWIKMLTQYMPKWSEPNFDLKANPDLTKHMWKLWNDLKAAGKSVRVIWVPAHNKRGTKNSTDPYEKFCYVNNDLVDKLAASVV